MGDKKNAYKFWWGKLKQREQLEDLGAEGITMLKNTANEQERAA
jgi:hypothetical protein